MTETKFKTKICLKDTLRSMRIGSELVIKDSVFKASSVRIAASNLKAKGFSFQVSDKGRVGDCVVTRLS